MSKTKHAYLKSYKSKYSDKEYRYAISPGLELPNGSEVFGVMVRVEAIDQAIKYLEEARELYRLECETDLISSKDSDWTCYCGVSNEEGYPCWKCGRHQPR